MKKQQEQIHKEMTIEEIFTHFPQKSQKLAQEMTNAGLHCVGCGAAVWETLEMGMLGHGFSEENVERLVSKLNAILEEELDLTAITITPRAVKKFIEIAKEEEKETWALRLGDRPGGCSGFEYILDFSKEASPKDTIFHSNGIDIHVETVMVERLLGCEIDYVDGLSGSGFKITNPNVKSSCSCGSSQSY